MKMLDSQAEGSTENKKRWAELARLSQDGNRGGVTRDASVEDRVVYLTIVRK